MRTNPSLLPLAGLYCLLAVGPVSAEQRQLVLGTDDLTDKQITITLGKNHPFLSWTKDEAEAFKKRLDSTTPVYRGTRYGWNHRTNGPPQRMQNGDPIAAGQVWLVTGDADAARQAADYVLKMAREFEADKFVELGCWNAPRQLQTSAICYDLVAGGTALSAEEDAEIRAYLRQAMLSLKKLEVHYGQIHNIGLAVDQGAWAAALCLEDGPMLKELFTRFRDIMSQGLLPGGYWYEGVAYGDMVRGNVQAIIGWAARSGLELAPLNCKRKPLSTTWTVPEGYVRPGDVFEWPYRVLTPFRQVPNIGDGGPSGRFSAHRTLLTSQYTRHPEFLNRYFVWDLTANKAMDPHVWGDFPPNPNVKPLERLGDVAFPEIGMFVFRQGTGLDPNDQYVMFHALPRTGYHPHADQGHISIARYGRWLSGDPESSACSTGYQKLRDAFSVARWAHNTVVVGGKWGKKEIGFPKVHYASATDPEAKVQVADVTISDFAEGIHATQRRRVLVTDHFIVVTDDLEAAEETTFDWFFHGANNAKWTLEDGAGEVAKPFLDYIPTHSEPDHHLQWHGAHTTRSQWKGTFLLDEKELIGLRVWHLDTEGGSYCSASLTAPKHGNPGLYADEKLYLVCQRKVGKEAHFTAVIEPHQGEPQVRSVQLLRNQPNDRLLGIELVDGAKRQVVIGDGVYEVR